MNRIWILLVFILFLAGCGEKEKVEIVEPLKFSVVENERLPEELLEEIDAKKAKPFKMTFTDEGDVYICVGYGEQETGGYSIQIIACNQLKNAISVDTNLLGPTPKDLKKSGKSYPYIVIKTKDLSVPVVFE